MLSGKESQLKQRIRKKLRTVGYEVNFSHDEKWERTIETFATNGLDRIDSAYGRNPWFWGVAWPAVFGAAAADSWPDIATPLERRVVAHASAKGHLETLLIAQGFGDAELLTVAWSERCERCVECRQRLSRRCVEC